MEEGKKVYEVLGGRTKYAVARIARGEEAEESRKSVVVAASSRFYVVLCGSSGVDLGLLLCRWRARLECVPPSLGPEKGAPHAPPRFLVQHSTDGVRRAKVAKLVVTGGHWWCLLFRGRGIGRASAYGCVVHREILTPFSPACPVSGSLSIGLSWIGSDGGHLARADASRCLSLGREGGGTGAAARRTTLITWDGPPKAPDRIVARDEIGPVGCVRLKERVYLGCGPATCMPFPVSPFINLQRAETAPPDDPMVM